MNFNYSVPQESSFDFQTLKPERNFSSDIESRGDNINYNTRRSSRHDDRTVAGLTIFAFVMLQSWRKSRNKIKNLEQTLANLKKSSARTEKQLRVYGSLVNVEQNRTDDLTVQLKRTLDNLKTKTASCKTFSITLSNIKNRQSVIEQKLKKTLDEYEATNEILAQTKRQLFHSMMDQRNLHLQLCKEQRSVQTLECEKKMLIKEIQVLNTENRKVEENYLKHLKFKDSEIADANDLLEKCRGALSEAQKKFHTHERSQKSFVTMQNELQYSLLRIADLQSNQLCSVCHRLGLFWKRLTAYQQKTLSFFHILAYYLLPATPSPTNYKFS